MSRPNINLGDLARDTISGFEGIVTSKTEWLNGCVRIGLSPKRLHDGKRIESEVFDIEQCELIEAAKKPAAPPSGGDRPSITRARDPR